MYTIFLNASKIKKAINEQSKPCMGVCLCLWVEDQFKYGCNEACVLLGFHENVFIFAVWTMGVWRSRTALCQSIRVCGAVR